ncbi:MAG: response regulator transcription factor [Chloroflexi bacterium]|nr:response regulator transcription factor [Chloroflexota bacterium]
MTSGQKILVVEDDRTLRSVLHYNLSKEGYDVVAAVDGIEAVNLARRDHPALVVLDLMLPGLNGLEVCRILRRETAVPILMLTAKAEEMDKVVGLEIGADDYVTKPFSMRELMARIRAMLRRVQLMETVKEAPMVRAGVIEVDVARHRATVEGKPLDLSPREFDLLSYLVRNKGFVFGRDHLLEKIWGYDFKGNTRTVDVHVRWLREKIENDPASPRRLLTVRGAGYKIEG